MNPEIALRLQAWLDGELPPAAAADMLRLTQTDPEAAALVRELKRTHAWLAEHEPHRVLPESREFYWSKIEQALLASERRGAAGPAEPARTVRWLRWLVPTAVTAALAVLLWTPTSLPRQDAALAPAEVESPQEDSGDPHVPIRQRTDDGGVGEQPVRSPAPRNESSMMTMNGTVACLRLLRGIALLFVWGVFVGAAETRSMEIKLRAQLIWGTNDEMPPRSECKEVSGKLREKLARVFKWKNYFEIKDEAFTVKPGEAQRVKMSGKCELELAVVDDFTLEVQLFGEGTLVKTIRQSVQALRQGELAVLAGDSKEKFGDAWFVVLSAPRK